MPEKITPANRISLPGLLDYDHLIQPTPSAMADKICAIIETHQIIIFSSRTKDLADLVSYVIQESFSANDLAQKIYIECKYRKMDPIAVLSVPNSWKESHFKREFGLGASL